MKNKIQLIPINPKPKDSRIKNSMFSFRMFIFYFSTIGFVTTCNFLLFYNHADQNETHFMILGESISSRAAYTFFNILLFCIIFTIGNSIKKSIFVRRPLNRILDATHKVTNGDFSVRIKPLHPNALKNEFDIIIEDFNKMIEELATTETLKTEFISNVSHEIKTPLAAVQNYATLLQEPGLSEEERLRYAHNLQNVAKKMEGLISNILKLNKLENQQIFPVNRRYNLTEQLCGCMLIFEDAWEKKNLIIKTDLQEDVMIECDSELLEIVWNNILSNAVKFNKKGGSIFLSLHTEKEKAIVKITDTGCGMSQETGKHIFDKFYQGDTSRSTQGNGLGLTIVKRVIDIVGGEIDVESALNIGTSFTVTLPLHR